MTKKSSNQIPEGYWAILFPLEDGNIGVRFREHPNIMTFGNDREHAIEMAREALNTTLESEIDYDIRLSPGKRPRLGPREEAVFVRISNDIRVAYMLRAWRRERGMTQKEVAEQLGVKYQSYQRMEKPGHANLTVTKLEQVASVLGKQLVIEAR